MKSYITNKEINVCHYVGDALTLKKAGVGEGSSN